MKIFLRILSVLGLLVWCACFALGYNYKEGGALMMSLMLGLALLVAMGLFLYLMNRWGNPTSGEHKANARSYEIICGVLYAVMVALSVTGVARFITVQSRVQNEVRPLAEERINELETVFGDESVAGSYRSYVEARKETYAVEVAAKYAGIDEEGKQQNVELEVSRLEDELTKNGTFDDTKANVDDFLAHCKYSVMHWVPWTITRYLADLDANLPVWETEVVKMSTDCKYTTLEAYSIESVAKDSLLDMVKNPKGGVFSALAIIVMLSLQIAILLFYFAGKDWSRQGPGRADFKHNSGIGSYSGSNN